MPRHLQATEFQPIPSSGDQWSNAVRVQHIHAWGAFMLEWEMISEVIGTVNGEVHVYRD